MPKHGYAIAVGHPHDATQDILERWLPQAQTRGLAIVPISAVMRVRLAADQQEAPRLQQAGGRGGYGAFSGISPDATAPSPPP